MAENSAKTRRFIVTKFDDENDKNVDENDAMSLLKEFWMSVCRPKCLDLTPIRFSNPTLKLLTHANIDAIKFVKRFFCSLGGLLFLARLYF